MGGGREWDRKGDSVGWEGGEKGKAMVTEECGTGLRDGREGREFERG